MNDTSKTSSNAEQTKARLIKEGIQLFALHGISGIRTRQLADAAGANQSAIPYHFGGKLGVYTAVIEHIANELAAEIHFEEFDNELAANSVNKPAAETLAVLIRFLVTGLCRALLAPEREYYSQIILREQLEPTESYQLIYNHLIEPFHIRLAQLIRLNNNTHSEQTITIRAHAIIGQILGFVIARKAFLLRINATNFSNQLLESITEEISSLSINALLN